MKVVIWSGGLDSTLLLADTLSKNGGRGVRAMTLQLEGLVQQPLGQRKGEKKARAEFKKWAKKKHGWVFKHDVVCVDSPADIASDVGQSGMWLSHLAPYIYPGDTMLFGYIRGDDFWHFRHLFVEAFGALKRSHYAGNALVQFPYEWHRKVDILAGAKRFKIPQRCWWTCETNNDRKTPCRKCSKCRQIQRAKDNLKEFGESDGVPVIRPCDDAMRSLSAVEDALVRNATENVAQEIDLVLKNDIHRAVIGKAVSGG